MVMINSTTSAVSSTPQEKDASSSAMADFDTFLKLLTAQLANQDPLNPTDGTEFTGQLAQFSSLEQQINTNDLIQELIESQPNTKQAEAMSYIGKEILAPGDNFILNDTGNVEFTFEAEKDVESASASVYNAEGEKVREFKVNNAAGLHEVLWDGRNDKGERLESGSYKVVVEASSINNKGATVTQELPTYIYGEAQKITNLGQSYALLTSDGRTTKLDDILGARDVKASTSAEDHANALQMLGKQILIPGKDFEYSGDDRKFTYGLTQEVQSVTITIRDEDGEKVLQTPYDPSEGSHEFTWNGKDSNGDDVDDGAYSIEVQVQNTNAEGEIEEQYLDTLYYGEATKVESSGGVVVIHTNDGRTALYDDVVATIN